MSQSSVNVPNTVPQASTANVEEHDPYTDPRFRRHYEWLTQLDPASLRHYALIEGLINDFQFKELAALGSPTEHSAKLLSYIKPFGMASFSALLETLRKACPLGEERICKLEELCYPQVVEHSGNVQHETFLLSPMDKIDISRTSPNRRETSGDSVANNMFISQETSSRNAGDSPKATSLRRSRQQVAAASAFTSGDPWKSEVYRKNYPFLIVLDKVKFRNHSFTAGFINSDEKDELASLGGEKSVHNEKLLMLGKGPGRDETFRLLVETVRLFGDRYSAVCEELEALLPAAVTVMDEAVTEIMEESLRSVEFWECCDVIGLGVEMSRFLDYDERRALAHAVAQSRDPEAADNYKSIILDYLAERNCGQVSLCNVPGLLLYFQASNRVTTFGELFDIVIPQCKRRAKKVAELIRDAAEVVKRQS